MNSFARNIPLGSWASLIGAVALISTTHCDGASPQRPEAARQTRGTSLAPPVSTLSKASSAVPAGATVPPGTHAVGLTNCQAPSVRPVGGIDARDRAALDRCGDLRSGEESFAKRCGLSDAVAPVDWERLDAAVLALDEGTRKNVIGIARRGRAQGRRPRVFGLVGDSMTVSWAFLRPFSAQSKAKFALGPVAMKSLATAVPAGPVDRQSTTIDFYRGVQAQRISGQWHDSFAAQRAAKIGARSPWAVRGDSLEQSPIAKLVKAVSPAVAIVAFGGNDAAYRVATPADIAAEFERTFEQVIVALEKRGIVPIMSTIARHGLQPGVDDCAGPGEVSDWRVAVQTNAVNAQVAAIACRRHLPLIDLRHALDGIPNHGLGPDGVIPRLIVTARVN